jgi:hypothetical protein
MEEPRKYLFIFRESPAYENVYRPQGADRGKSNLTTTKLLSIKFI